MAPTVAFAGCLTTANCGFGEICIDGDCETLVPDPFPEDIENNKDLGAIKNLPKVEGTVHLIKSVVETILEFSMFLTLVGIVIAAIYYLQSLGNEEETTKAKNTLKYLLIGLLVMAASYGIVTGIAQIDLFNTA